MPGLSRTSAEKQRFRGEIAVGVLDEVRVLRRHIAGWLTKSMNFSAASGLPASFGITKESNHISAPSFGIT
jgi:hypothetical protein